MQAAMHTMTKVVHDKVSPTHNQAMSLNCEGPINAMHMNKDMSKVVVAGRQVFKIIEITDDSFMETSNLRVSKHKSMNLNYSAADVAWNHNDENMLASAATNGAVVIWNLSKQVKSKQDFVFTEHKRSVNRVVFHNSEGNQLLSGSQDGTMKLHDLRKKQVSLTFTGRNSESVRDIQFCPPNLGYFTFAAAYENGIIQIWDMRRPDRCEKHFTAHNEPVFAVDWHPEDKHWLATAGRDKMIKIWDVSKQPAQLLYTVQTIASVGRIKWRPQRRYHIANCSLLLDHNVNVWDVRRPYIPFACFDQHKDVATSVLWKDPHVLLSTGKDSMLHQHLFQHAKRPGDYVIPSGVDMSINGQVCLAYREKSAVKGKESGKLSMFNRKSSQSRSELFFTQANSSMAVFQQVSQEEAVQPDFGGALCGRLQLASQDVSMSNFLRLAKGYRLKGLSTEELCRHNSAAAAVVDKHQIAHTWQILGDIFCSKPSVKSGSLQVPRVTITPNALMDRPDAEKGKTVSSPDNELEVVRSDVDKEKNNVESTGSDEDSDGESSEYEKNQLADIASGLGHNGDFFFGDGDTDELSYSLGINVRGGEDWTQLPPEAFQPRHEITGPAAPPDRPYHDSLLGLTGESEAGALLTPVEDGAPPLHDHSLNIDLAALHSAPALDYTSIAVTNIQCFAEQGDLQTAVTMMIVLGEHVRPLVDLESQENWFMSYIDLLSRFQLWTIASEVIALSQLPQVMQLNQSSTNINTACPLCTRTTERSGWLCHRCRAVVNLCSVCHCPVKGLFVWCQGCCHGGHIHHIQDWLASNIFCPEGCGHICEYT